MKQHIINLKNNLKNINKFGGLSARFCAYLGFVYGVFVSATKHTKIFAKHHIPQILIACSFIVGLISVFVFGYKVGTESSLAQSHIKHSFAFMQAMPRDMIQSQATQYLQQRQTQKTPQDLQEILPLAPQTPTNKAESKPIMPAFNQDESIISGNLTYHNALSIARNNLNNGDFNRARIWIYRAYQIESTKEVWDLFLRSYQEDSHTKNEQKLQATKLYHQAKRYYGF